MAKSNNLDIALNAAVIAGEKIMEVYNSTDDILYDKKSDNSPLTIADKRSHEVIVKFLKKTEINIISEESKSIEYDERKNWDQYWLIDPLDGTKEFIKKNSEFTVNIALIKNNMPYLGVVYCPVKKILYWNNSQMKAFKKTEKGTKELHTRPSINENDKGLRVVVSRSHMNDDTNKYLKNLSPFLVEAH